MMQIDIITIFPKMVDVPLSESLIGKGRQQGNYIINVHDLRDFTHDKHKVVDDIPYGGGPGMVMKPEPIVEALRQIDPDKKAERFLTSAAGELFSQNMAVELTEKDRIIIICGHYKGVDQRAVKIADLKEISIGDYALTGGEHAACVMVDAVLRLLPGTMKDFGSAEEDSHFKGILGPEEYTRPEEFEGFKVPEVLISGHHENIRKWRLGNALYRTKTRRPDLFKSKSLTEDEIDALNKY
ncbi:MAG: tRNA (guanosine(37)-N1)-methyltransferase TrmD [Candidatus Zixiibacteriota bacterium]|nr:MAG: tRNA (guanosine(37)-N1)-methyltransferase TrmD [candidate division Zixibacteria bacterium]